MVDQGVSNPLPVERGRLRSSGIPVQGTNVIPECQWNMLSKSASAAWRRQDAWQVTVLFADLKSSMELLADRDPEEPRKLLHPVLERRDHGEHPDRHGAQPEQIAEHVLREAADEVEDEAEDGPPRLPSRARGGTKPRGS